MRMMIIMHNFRVFLQIKTKALKTRTARLPMSPSSQAVENRGSNRVRRRNETGHKALAYAQLHSRSHALNPQARSC